MKKSTPNPFELHQERLATTSEKGQRVYLYPASVKGRFRRFRTQVYAVLMALFLGIPWIKIGGQPLILLDIIHRHFVLFGVSFWADDAPLLFLGLATWVVGIAALTALFGRFWCGWACPQTVFIDLIYRRIEQKLEGSPREQRALDRYPFSFKTLRIRTLKYSLFVVVSLLFAHSFAAYFVGADALLAMMTSSPLRHLGTAELVGFITLLLVFDFGWFREQFCVIACPYGRLQSVMLDRESLIVGYHNQRGEPRHKEASASQTSGDCINCYRCVQVCPTGIDIRRGLQMECIMCTACMDACDTVMTKMNRPLGLISYTSEAELTAGLSRPWWQRIRVWIYLVFIALSLSLLTYALSQREPIRVFAVRGNEGFSVLNDRVVINHFRLHVYSHAHTVGRFTLSPDSGVIFPQGRVILPPGKNTEITLFVEVPKSGFLGGVAQKSIRYIVTFENGAPLQGQYTLDLVGPQL